MVKRKVTKRKKVPKRTKTDRFPLIDKALRKRTKEDVITLILRLAKDQGELARALESELGVEKPHDLLVADIAAAIDRATDFDEGKLNYNFDYDWQAYEDVEKGFRKLVKLGHLEDTKALALKLMKDGSYQVECSDEGMMTDDITACLKPVILAVKKDSGEQANKWAFKMLLADRVGFICDDELKMMSGQ